MNTVIQTVLSGLKVESSGVPIYVQLRDQMLRFIGAGLLKAGDQMPTMRQVAVALKVDLNTIRHAYEELEHVGAIALVRGRGSFVAERLPAQDEKAHARRLDEFAFQTIAAATAAGFDIAALCARLIALTQGKESAS
jgi:GntR family transcriptional regulator